MRQGTILRDRELATHLPVTIVSSAIGLLEERRERIMEWSIGLFNCIGPINDRARNAVPVLSEMMLYARTHAVPGKLKPGRATGRRRSARRLPVRSEPEVLVMEVLSSPRPPER